MAKQVHPRSVGSDVAPGSDVRTFLIADVRAYTRFTFEQGDEAAARLASRFADVTEEIVGARGGQVVELRGDEALAVFSSARQALRSALEMQERFAREVEADPSLPLHVGIGLDAGEAVRVRGGYRGAALNLAARLQSLARSGEVLASEGVVHLAGKTQGLRYVERGPMSLKGFEDPIHVIQVLSDAAGAAGTPAPLLAQRAALSVSEAFAVRIIGAFELLHNGVRLDTSGWRPRMRSLFLLIATADGHRRLRDEVIDMLWPESSAQTGPSNLRFTLHMLRRALGNLDPSPVLFEGGWLSLNPAYRWEIDLERFDQLVSEDDIESLEQAAKLYRGEALPENRYDDWARPVREHVDRRWRELCLHLGRIYRALGSYQEAGEWLDRAVQSDPLDEEAMQKLLGCLIENDRRTEALRRYREFERRLLEELDVPPASETAALVEGMKDRTEYAPALPPAPPATSIARPVEVVPTYPLPTRGPFAGRDDELSHVMDLVAGLDQSTGQGEVLPRPPARLVHVPAEAGTGKTRFLSEVAQRAREMDVLVLAGGCYEQEGRLAYGPIHDALADYVRAQPPLLLEQIRGLEAEIARIVPEIRALTVAGEEESRSDLEGERMRLFLAVSQVLDRMSRDTPLLLILDDLQWADDATLQLLHFLLRQPGLDRLLVLGAYRIDELVKDAPLLQLVHDSRESERIVPIRLQPLSPPDLAKALEARLGGPCAPDLVTALHARSGGNPLFALQMAGLLQEEERLESGEDGWRMVKDAPIDLPPAVRDTISRRLRHLTADQREGLTLGAVLGREFSYAPLERLWRGDERALFDGLDLALEAHIVEETGDGYAFRHPLLWEVTYHRVPGARRAVLHERAALALEDMYGDQADDHAPELAHHFASAGRVHTDRALRYLMAAGDQAERGYAHAEAEGYYRRALELARAAGKRAGLTETLEKLGGVLKASNRLGEALEVLEEAAEKYRREADVEGEGRVVALIGLIHYFRGSFDEGINRLEPVALRLAQQGQSRGLALLYAALPRVYLPVGRYAEGLAAARRAVKLARETKDQRLIPDAEFIRGRALLESGRLDDAIPALEKSIRLAEDLPDLFVLTAACGFAGNAYLARGDVRRSRGYFERSLRAAEERGGLEQMPGGLWRLTDISFLLGDWQAARLYAERHRQLSIMHSGRPGPVSLRIRGMLALHGGDWEHATRLLTEFAALAERENRRNDILRAGGLLAELELLQGRFGEAVARLHSLRQLSDSQEKSDLLIVLAWAELEAGNVSAAGDMIDTALPLAHVRDAASDQPTHIGLPVDALRVKGLIRAREGERRDAEKAFSEAATLAQPMPYPYGEARARYEWGRMRAEGGELEPARSRLEEALAIFRRLGARPYVEWTEEKLGQLGAG